METKLSVARPGANSLRSTVPQGVVAFLEVADGDGIDWFKMDIIDGERVVMVRKSK